MKSRRTYLLLAAVAVLGAITAYSEIAPTTAPPSDGAANSSQAAPQRTAARSPDAAAESPPPAGNPLWALPREQLSTTRERPIFSPSRRPPPPTQTFVAPVVARTPPKPAEPSRPTITLLGTILGGAESIGVFFNPATRDIVRLRLGEDHEGWALRAVKTREVTLVKDRERVVLQMPPPGESTMSISDFMMADPRVPQPPQLPRRQQPRR